MTTPQNLPQNLPNVDKARLGALYENGDYAQALQWIDAWGLPGLLE